MPHLKQFISLFSGRKDCYGRNNFCLKEELTPKIFQDHINGIQRIGIYPIYDNKWIKWIAADLDEDDFNKALAIKHRAENLQLKIYLERSKSKGYHIYCFFKLDS